MTTWIRKEYEIENDYLDSGLNDQLFPAEGFEVNTEFLAYGWKIVAPDGTFLFSIEKNTGPDSRQRRLYFWVAAVGIILAVASGIAMAITVIRLRKQKKYGWGIVVLAFYLIGVRGLMLYFNLPNSIVETDLFNSKYYASSTITPSLGDLLLNVLVALILVGYAFGHFFQSRLYQFYLTLPSTIRTGLMVVAIGFGHWLLYLHFYVLRSIYLYSQLSLDITRSLDFSFLKIVCLFIFICNSTIYFLTMYLIFRLEARLGPDRRIPLLVLLTGSFLFALLSHLGNFYYPEVIIIHTVYGLLVLIFKLPQYLFGHRHSFSIYLFLTVLVCAAVGAFMVYRLEEQKRLVNMQKFGVQMLADQDEFGEFLLNEASFAIQEDQYIISRFSGPFISEEAIADKVRVLHLGSYFTDRYEVEVHAFDPAGYHLRGDDQPHSYFDFERTYRKKENGREIYRTAYPNLYFINELGRNFIKQYVSMLPIRRAGLLVGYVVIDLKQKRMLNRNVYPALLVHKRFSQAPEVREYSYAVFKGSQLAYTEGDYNYHRSFPVSTLRNQELCEDGVILNNYHHIAVSGAGHKLVVVSAPAYPAQNFFSNFSFLFIVLVLVIALGVLIRYLAWSLTGRSISFAAKIQLYLNIAFFLPMVAVSVATLSIIHSAYRQDLNRSFLEQAENVSNSMQGFLDQYQQGLISEEQLSEEISHIARHSQSDINVFNPLGRLLISSQPEIYKKGVLSRYISQNALIAIGGQGEEKILLAESVGRLHYNSVYVGIRSFENHQLLGIASIPFFESKAELDRQVIEVLATIMNIFTAIFIGLLVFSYFAARVLTIPLELITRKLQKTSLEEYNEPLQWNSNDEIGLMVGEYNRMWREMAQQVAHEIKNPLTPMKLTLQHLQRTLRRDDPAIADKTDKPIATLLTQVDTLSDIATSFSAFAKMPIPKDELFDLADVLRKTTELYRTDQEVQLETHIPEGNCMVRGDAQLLGRIITNLILNGIQSVPHGRTPKIIVSLEPHGHQVLIS